MKRVIDGDRADAELVGECHAAFHCRVCDGGADLAVRVPLLDRLVLARNALDACARDAPIGF
jgi:hypothetical protein